MCSLGVVKSLALDLPHLARVVLAGLVLNLLTMSAHYRHMRGSASGRLQIVRVSQLYQHVRRHPDAFWIGTGFHWTRALAQRLHQRLCDPEAAASTPRLLEFSRHRYRLRLKAQPRLEHLLVLGAPGTGKTQLFKMLALQALMRHEAVIILDPKGGESLRSTLAHAAQSYQRPYFQLLPSRPDLSHAIDLLANGQQASELASRLCYLLPFNEGENVFGQFAWLTLQRIFQGMLLLQHPLSFAALRQHVADQGRSLYAQLLRHPRTSTALESALGELNTLCMHDATHYQKMILSLTPILQNLSTGVLAQLLCPPPPPTTQNVKPPRAVFNLDQITPQGGVFYASLESLSDASRARALGALILADLAALAGNRYRSGTPDAPKIRLFVDEASESSNPAFIQLLNKGRESGISVTFAVQTLADLEVALGSASAARMMVGNAGHFIAFRTLDAQSRQIWSERAGSSWIRLTQNSLSAQESQGLTGARRALSAGRAQGLQNLPLIPEMMLAHLPDLHYVLLHGNGDIVTGCLPLISDRTG